MFQHTRVCAQAIKGTLTLAVVPACDHGVEKLAETQLANTPGAVLADLCVAAHHLEGTGRFESLLPKKTRWGFHKHAA